MQKKYIVRLTDEELLRAFLALRQAGALALACGTHLDAQEFRALWADAFHAGFRSSNEVNQMVADARAGRSIVVLAAVKMRIAQDCVPPDDIEGQRLAG